MRKQVAIALIVLLCMSCIAIKVIPLEKYVPSFKKIKNSPQPNVLDTLTSPLQIVYLNKKNEEKRIYRVRPFYGIADGTATPTAYIFKPKIPVTVGMNKPMPKNVYYRNKVIVLMFHQVSLTPPNPSIITPVQFESQIKAIVENGFHVISMEEYARFILEKQPVPDNSVLLTFDDGYESFYSIVFPILRKYNVTATNFVIASTIGNRNAITTNPKMTWDQMREMKMQGMSFYSHTFDSHLYGDVDANGKQRPKLSSPLYLKDQKRVETQEEYEKRIYDDFMKAEELLRGELGNTRSILAFPYGSYNDKVREITKKANISLTFTITPGINAQNMINGFRYNAGNQKIRANRLIELLKRGGNRYK